MKYMDIGKKISEKTLVWLLVLFLALILIILVLRGYTLYREWYPILEVFIPNGPGVNITYSDLYYIPEGLFCSALQSGYSPYYTNKAMKEGNISICDGSCSHYGTWNCYSDFAINVSNVSICNKIPNQISRDSCLYDYGLNKSNLQICLDVSYNDLKYECSAKLQENTTICNKIEDNKRYRCINWIGVKRNDTDICDEIEIQYKRWTCYSDIAANTLNISICDKIEDEYWRDNCYHNIAVIEEDYTICGQIQGDFEKDSCYSHFAYSTRNISYCEAMTNSYKVRCYEDLKD